MRSEGIPIFEHRGFNKDAFALFFDSFKFRGFKPTTGEGDKKTFCLLPSFLVKIEHLRSHLVQLTLTHSASPPPRPRAAIKSSVTRKNAKKGSLAMDR